MRNIINISLPQNMADLVKQEVRTGNYASTSEFFRHLIREWNTQQLAKRINKSRKAISQGKGKTARSLEDLR